MSEAVNVLDFIEWPEEPSTFWLPTTKTVLQLPLNLMVDEWADNFYVLSEKTTHSPGPWRTCRVPYIREILNCWKDKHCQQISWMASTQVSKTEGMKICLGYSSDQDPGPALFVLPADDDMKKMNTKRIQPMFEDSPKLAAHLTGNPDHLKTTEIELKRMYIFFGSSRSPSQLSSMPIRYLFMDEVDKYDTSTAGGKEANPINLARERTRTYPNRKIFMACTPTLETGNINVEYQKGTREKYHVPCPHCGCFQVLYFKNIVWPEDVRDPERIQSERLAGYYCPECGEEISDLEKAGMLEKGVWISEKYEFIDAKTGEITGERPRPCLHRSFWINCLYSPWLTWSEIAAEFLRSKDDRTSLQNFKNSWLAEVWKETAEAPELAGIMALRCELPSMKAPAKTRALYALVDTQGKGFYFAVWAFSETMESWCIHYGYLNTFEEVEKLLVNTRYEVEGLKFSIPIYKAGIDTGGNSREDEDAGKISRTEEVMTWVREMQKKHPGFIHGIKGASEKHKTGAKVRVSQVDCYPGSKRKIHGGFQLWIIDVHQMKDVFNWRLTKGHESGQSVHLHAETDEEFCRHLLAEERRRNPKTKKWGWVKIRKRNDWLDCAVYAHAFADPSFKGGVKSAPRLEYYEQMQNAAKNEPKETVKTWTPPAMGGFRAW